MAIIVIKVFISEISFTPTTCGWYSASVREKAPRENPPNGEKSLYGGFSRGELSLFRPENAKGRHAKTG